MPEASAAGQRKRGALGLSIVLAITALGAPPVLAQQTGAKAETGTQATGTPPASGPMSLREAKRRSEKLRRELLVPYRKWLDEDVAYIITDEERAMYRTLGTDSERDHFIEQFWLRRDPTPDTPDNEFKQEHYRRILYANEQFASRIPGWKTDRGHVYIVYGPPDEIESKPSGSPAESYPSERWLYRYLESFGGGMKFEFSDTARSGEYHLTAGPSQQVSPLYTPNGLNVPGFENGPARRPMPQSMKEFEQLERIATPRKMPGTRFKDLEAAADAKITENLLPMSVRADFFPATSISTVTNLTLEFVWKDLQLKNSAAAISGGGISATTIQIYGRITAASRDVTEVFQGELPAEIPTETVQEAALGRLFYQKSIPLAAGDYRANIVVKDVNSGRMNNYETTLTVPRLDEDHLATSSLVLADILETVPRNLVGGSFLIGNSKVRPRPSATFHRGERMGIYMKVYNLTADEKTFRPRGDVTYEVVRAGSDVKVVELTESLATMEGAPSQVTIRKLLPTTTFEVGNYTLRLKVADAQRNEALTRLAEFSVTP